MTPKEAEGHASELIRWHAGLLVACGRPQWYRVRLTDGRPANTQRSEHEIQVLPNLQETSPPDRRGTLLQLRREAARTAAEVDKIHQIGYNNADETTR